MTEDKFPLVRITGGPHAKNMAISQDGVPMRAVTKFVLRASVDDVAILITRQIVKFDVEMEVEPEQFITEEEIVSADS